MAGFPQSPARRNRPKGIRPGPERLSILLCRRRVGCACGARGQRHHGAQGDHLVGEQAPGGDQVQPGLLLGLPEDPFLSAAPPVKEDDVTCRGRFVGHHDPVVMVELSRLKQIQLQRLLGLSFDPAAHEDKPIRGRPACRFPRTFEIGPFLVQIAPAFS